MALPEGPKAVESAALEAASSSNRGSGWAPRGPASSWECRAAQSRQARPEEAQEASWGAAKRGTLTMLRCCRRIAPLGVLVPDRPHVQLRAAEVVLAPVAAAVVVVTVAAVAAVMVAMATTAMVVAMGGL
eukprot:scaffold62868_cov28-Phaeocystis_antarctica.AAC.1